MKVRLVLVALAIAAVIAVLAGGAGGARSDYPTFVFAVVAADDIRGTVAVTQRTRRLSADSFVSLHGLTTDTSYRASVSELPCSRAAAPTAGRIHDPMGAASTAPGEDDLFASDTGPLRKKLAAARSVRLYEQTDDGAITQVACARALRVR